MAKLLLKFDNRTLAEVPIESWPITIGRAPDNVIHIDNLAVSDYHARVYTDEKQLLVEDLGSLNGTFLNSARVKRQILRSNDVIRVGKHAIVVDLVSVAEPALSVGRRVAAPKVNETVMVGTRGESGSMNEPPPSEEPVPERARVPSLIVIKGKVSQMNHLLSNKLTIIGKSPMATIRLRGWFAPQIAAQITKTKDGYYLGLSKNNRLPKVNGITVKPPVRLNDGDLIEISGVILKFMYRE
jgi:pSer/pThr/pTyr-binding forkhead associated (FHA) protein